MSGLPSAASPGEPTAARNMSPRPSAASYAHHQEDLAVLDFFAGRTGCFVEAGANHPVESSQTYLLEQHGWRGILIEPNPRLAALCRELRPEARTFDCALIEPGGPAQVHFQIPAHRSHEGAHVASLEIPIRPGETFAAPGRTLDEVLAEANLPRIDYLSMDLEGYEPVAFRGFSLSRWRPALLSIEDHCESLATSRIVAAHGYRFLRRIGDNDWYVPPESPHRASASERLRRIRKKYLSLPFRKFRRLSRRLRGMATD